MDRLQQFIVSYSGSPSVETTGQQPTLWSICQNIARSLRNFLDFIGFRLGLELILRLQCLLLNVYTVQLQIFLVVF